MPAPSLIDHARVRELKQREDARFHAARPLSLALWQRAQAVMPNGVPMAWHRSSYHHLPLWVSEGLGARFTDLDAYLVAWRELLEALTAG
ncbi:MAG: Glutamate-1-semialdehyde aminotransferase [Steroidobacteraceae bacterium]|jgi:hypothetical protein|nr:Glutamate-1-semialdehyde aminotransferase [Steroidobacteraceae bacterium]